MKTRHGMGARLTLPWKLAAEWLPRVRASQVPVVSPMCSGHRTTSCPLPGPQDRAVSTNGGMTSSQGGSSFLGTGMRESGLCYEQVGMELGHLSEADAAGLSPRTLRYHLSRQSHFGPSHWQWLVKLAQVKLLPDESAEALAGRYTMDVRTLRQRIQTCLDISLDKFRHLVG